LSISVGDIAFFTFSNKTPWLVKRERALLLKTRMVGGWFCIMEYFRLLNTDCYAN